MQELLMAIAIKFKGALASLFAAYVASSMRYLKAKRAGKKATFSSWALFGLTAWLVTYSAMTFLDYCCDGLSYEMRIGIAFWCGYMSDYFYGWIPEYIKSKLPNNKE
jgi:hypothetical protein